MDKEIITTIFGLIFLFLAGSLFVIWMIKQGRFTPFFMGMLSLGLVPIMGK